MSFPAYPSYQGSEVEWLGEVPSHWAVTRLKRACSIFASNVDKRSVEGQDAVRLCNYTDVYYNDLIGATLPFMEATATSDQIERFSLIAGDTIITKDSESPDDIARSAYVLTTLPGVICGYHLSMVRPFPTAHGPFIKRYFDSAHARAYFHTNANGLTRVGLGQYSLDNAPLALPPLAEQVAIAAFLDLETAKIDALIKEQRRLIALLKEKRQAVISHAVTKGLDPHAPMKDSGVEWLGEVPAHWNIKPLKQLAAQGTSITYGIVQAGPDIPDGVPYIRTSDMSGDQLPAEGYLRTSPEIDQAYARSKVSAGDLVIAIRATVGKPLIVPPLLEGANLTQGTAKFSPSAIISARFAQLVLGSAGASSEFERISKGATFKEITLEMLRNFRVPVPPTGEQKSIVIAIDSQLRAFSELIDTAELSERLLTERRAALISAAVTGKIDVRGSANVLPFPIDRTRARALVGTEIIERSAGQSTFGRVKFQKVAFLAEGHVGIGELEGCYTRAAAGPLDGALIDDMERGAHSIAGIAVDQAGGTGTTVSYRLGQQRGAHRQELADWLGPDRTAKLAKLIADFAPLNTKQAEAVATLYGVWNDLLSEGVEPSDDEIITGFLNDWHPQKREKFRAGELPEWLGWMRRHGIVPTGSGPKTTTGRLFV